MTNPELPEARQSGLASGWTVQPETAVTQDPTPSEPESEQMPQAGLSNVAVMMLGVFGGFYLLYTWGWFEIAQANAQANAANAEASGLIGGILQQIVFWIAPLAPAVWFLSSYLFTRKAATIRLAILLFVGLIVLLPFPILISMTGGVA